MNKETTGERLMKIETQLDYVSQSLDENKKEHQLILNKLDGLDNKYASKETEERVGTLQKEVNNIHLKIATVAGAAIVIWFIVQVLLKKYGFM